MAGTFLWSARQEADDALGKELKSYAVLLDETFLALDDCIVLLENLNSPFGRVCGLVLIKARNLGLGCYSLSLDALAQEAGALFRPLVECLELLEYFRLEPPRVREALEDRLPKAGIIAQRIEGKFKDLREHLNSHASHLSLSSEAMRHLIDFKSGRLRAVQTHDSGVLHQNLRTLLAILAWLAIETANCTSVGTDNVDLALGDRVEDVKRRAFILFDEPTR